MYGLWVILVIQVTLLTSAIYVTTAFVLRRNKNGKREGKPSETFLIFSSLFLNLE